MTTPEHDYARCFSTPAGIRVLQHMKSITHGRTFGPNVTDNELRWAESQRAFVRHIETMISRGRGDGS